MRTCQNRGKTYGAESGEGVIDVEVIVEETFVTLETPDVEDSEPAKCFVSLGQHVGLVTVTNRINILPVPLPVRLPITLPKTLPDGVRGTPVPEAEDEVVE